MLTALVLKGFHMKFSVNKNLIHDGKHYSKGHAIKESDENFKTLQSMGHVDEVKHHEKAEIKPETKPLKPAESKKQSEG